MILLSRKLEGLTGHEAGRALLAQAYFQATGEALPEVRIAEGGRPYFPDSPWQFSITHTKRHAFCALGLKNVGIDAEELDRPINLKLADKVLSSMERAQFDASEDKRRALLTFWVLKEAAVKLAGTGLRGYPNDTSFSLGDPRVQEIHGCLVAVLTE